MTKTGKEIRTELKDKYGYTDDQLKLGKKELREQLELLENEIVCEIKEGTLENMLEQFEVEEEQASVDVSELLEQPIQPSMDSPEWADYVLSQFRLDEMDQGNPTILHI